MNKVYTACFLLLLAITNSLRAANEFYVKGAGATATATVFNNGGLIFVNGEFNNNDGLVTNAAGTIEVTGNWTNTSASNKYQSSGTERFYGTSEQTISGTMNGTTASGGYNINQFNNLKVYRNSTVTAIPAKYITLAKNVNVANTIDFELISPNATIAGTGDNQAVIRTDPSSPTDVGTYANELYLLNPSAGALTHYATISGNGNVRYVEGKLRRQVNAADTYEFPIGFKPGIKDGMEGFKLKFNVAPNNKSIVGYIQDSTTGVPTRNVVCDVGKDPGPGNDPFPNCVGGPDGILDLYVLDKTLDSPNEWVATPSDAVGTINYDATFYPGTGLDDITQYYVIPAACSTPYAGQLLRVMAKDGLIGGTSAIYPFSGFPWAHLTSFAWCQFTPSGQQAIGLSGQTSFSKFRIFGTPLGGSTALPVELTSFTLSPINNEFFLLNWQTASEFNNAGYTVQRSTGGAHFQDIGWVAGHGTSNQVNNYSFSDRNVEANITYYYRLKQIDIDQKYKYTYVLSGQLIGNKFDILSVSPNPTPGDLQATIYIPAANTLNVSIYDIVGKEVKNSTTQLQKGKNTLNLDISDLAAATYLFRFTLNDQVITKKIVKN